MNRARPLLALLLALGAHLVTSDKPIVLHVKEEVRVGTVISNSTLQQSRAVAGRSDTFNSSRWRILNRGSELFGIDMHGAIYVRSRIDLESFCSQFSTCCPQQRSNTERASTLAGTNQRVGPNECALSLQLEDDLRLTPLVIIVQDVNEFVPQFPQTSINLAVYENNGEQQLRIPIPKDADATSSRFATLQITYLDSDPAGQNFIALSNTNRRVDTWSSAEIRLPFVDRSIGSSARFELDRERKDTYRFRITACEPESNNRCGNATVTVTVLDMNDNKPRFSLSEYELTVYENASTHTSLYQVLATDADADENGQVHYSVEPGSIKCVSPGTPVCKPAQDDYDSGDIIPLFSVNDNGYIMLNQQIDYENCTLLTFRVQARDRGSPALASFADVKVNVLDVDDTKPCLRLEPKTATVDIEESKKESGGDPARAFNRLSPIVVVSDPDTHKAGVLCRSDVPDLVQLSEMNVIGNQFEKTYQIVPTRTFDRELEAQHQIRLVCSDRNFTDEPYLEQLSFWLNVLDVNDNAPQFGAANISATLRENSPPDTIITTLHADDSDAEANAQVEYSLLYESPFLVVEPNGLVKSRESIDREKRQQIEVVVIARDSGTPRLSSTAMLVVSISDENDCPPKFDREMYKFDIPENVPTGGSQYYIGDVKATDADTDSTLTYSLLNGTEYFLITAQAGSLFLQRPIDREQFQRYTLVVAVSDSDSLGAHTSTIPVHVWIDDVNDHRPRITAPSKENHTVRVACPKETYPNGYRVYQANAVDEDATSENRQIEYQLEIVSPLDAPRGAFRIENSTGEIYFMLPTCTRSYVLKVIAVDAENRGLRSEQSMQILFVTPEVTQTRVTSESINVHSSLNDDQRLGGKKPGQTSSQNPGLTNHQLMIVLATTLFILFIALLVVLLVFVRVSKRKAEMQKGRRKTNDAHTESGRTNHRRRQERPDNDEFGEEQEAASVHDEQEPHDDTYSDQDERSEPVYEDGELNNNYAQADTKDAQCASPYRRNESSKSMRNTPLHSEVHSFKPTGQLSLTDGGANTYCDSVSPPTRRTPGNATGQSGANSASQSYHSFQLLPVSQNFSTLQKFPTMVSRSPFATSHHQTLQLKNQQQHWLAGGQHLRCVPLKGPVNHYDASAVSQTMSFQNAVHSVPGIHNSVLTSTMRNGSLEHKVVPTTPQRATPHGDPSSFV